MEIPRETQLLGRIGDELAALYQETLHAPLPDDLQELVELLGPDGTPAKSEAEQP